MNGESINMDFPNKIMKETVEEIMESENISNAETVVTSGSNAGDNYFGTLYKVRTTGLKNGKTSELSLIYKTAPVIAGADGRHIALIYDREIYMYETILTKLNNLQIDEIIPNNRKLRFPKCYRCVKGKGNKGIVMEDVTTVGFKIANRLESLDWNQVKVVLENMSRLHGLSYVMKSREPDTFAMLSKSVEELLYTDKQEKGGVFFRKNGIHESLFLKALMAVKDKGLAQRLFRWTHDKRKEYLCRLSSHKVHSAVICHGDSWTNNYMFKYNEAGEPVELCFIDWQLAKCASPITDIMYMLGTSTDGQFRAKYYDQVFEYYYSCLDNYLQFFSIDIEKFYPRRKFFNDKQEYAPYCIFWGFLVNGITLGGEGDVNNAVSTEELVNIDKSNFSAKNTNQIYVKRINDLVEDFSRYGCI